MNSIVYIFVVILPCYAHSRGKTLNTKPPVVVVCTNENFIEISQHNGHTYLSYQKDAAIKLLKWAMITASFALLSYTATGPILYPSSNWKSFRVHLKEQKKIRFTVCNSYFHCKDDAFENIYQHRWIVDLRSP